MDEDRTGKDWIGVDEDQAKRFLGTLKFYEKEKFQGMLTIPRKFDSLELFMRKRKAANSNKKICTASLVCAKVLATGNH